MKLKTLILMVVAVGCGLAASYMTSRLLAERSAPPTDAKVAVVVAKQKVSPMVLIKEPERYFELKDYPEGLAPRKALKTLEDIKDQRLNKSVTEEEIVTYDHVLNKEQAGLPAELPTGTRAVAIKVNPESLVGGFVLPRSRVDVMFTSRGGAADAQTKVLLQDMLVLAVDQSSQRDPNEPTKLGNTVTLAAKPEEAQRLALASTLGELRLTLRALGDNERIRLPATKLSEFDRPIREGSNDETQLVQAPPPVPTLPKLEALPPPPTAETKPTPKEKEKPKPEPEEPPVKTHTMTIVNGEYVQKAVFVEDPQEGWKNGALSRDEGPPVRTAPAGRPGKN
jgi:pilus assembly protein CpaB